MVVSLLLPVSLPAQAGKCKLRKERIMAKLDETEGEVLSTGEMKSTKGGLAAASEALARGTTASEALKMPIIEETSLQAEAILPASQPAAGATEDALRLKKR
jgi:hypothetical protein